MLPIHHTLHLNNSGAKSPLLLTVTSLPIGRLLSTPRTVQVFRQERDGKTLLRTAVGLASAHVFRPLFIIRRIQPRSTDVRAPISTFSRLKWSNAVFSELFAPLRRKYTPERVDSPRQFRFPRVLYHYFCESSSRVLGQSLSLAIHLQF